MSASILTQEEKTLIKGNNCFDFLRYLFAISLIIAHFCTLTQIEQFWFISGGMRVKAFFIITGFLVTYSFLSRGCNKRIYAIKRAVRILPAYMVVIVFGMIIGGIFTTLDSASFWQNVLTWRYAVVNLFMLNWWQPWLPGLFEGNYMSAVNGSLWSMKFEVLFYIMVPFVIWLISKWNKHLSSLLICIGIIAVNLWPNLPIQGMYFCYFFVGMLGLLEFSYFKRYIWPISAVAVALALTDCWVDVNWINRLLHVFEPFIFAAILLGVAYTCQFLSFFRRLPNVTYGLYLYHFPIIQILISLGLAQYNLWLCFFIALLLTFIMANLSWFGIEKPLMDKYK